jgi:flagellar FliL protein
MSEATSPPPPEDALEPGTEFAGRGASILSKLYLALFVGAVIGVECLVAYLYIPTPAQTAAAAGILPDADPQANASADATPQAADPMEDQLEVDLGQFHVISFQPVSNTTLRIDFHVFGTIDPDDKTDFDQAWEENTHRIRDQVITTVRGCELSELTDAGLGLIKRKILEKSNRTLGKPLLQAVIFSEFSFIEQ